MLNTDFQQFIALSKYARWDESKGRRETWEESVDRYIVFLSYHLPCKYSKELSAIRDSIVSLDVMPSMRALWAAGPDLARCNVAAYNCSYVAVDSPKVFDEILYVLMRGTGVGFSVERQYINQLPEVPEELYDTDTTIAVADSKIGWATAFRELINLLYAGKVPRWDLHKLRPAGARLKTSGGRSSGPMPLDGLFRFTVGTFKGARGRKLNSLECHDLVCKIADIIVVGGVRRSALLSLSNLTDERMRTAKTGQWWETNGQRALANNSVCYTEKPDMSIFLKEWSSLYESKSGERGIFYRGAAKRAAARSGRRNEEIDFGTNPCSEIILRPKQFCNLSEVIVRPTDTLDTLKRKVQFATILGTIQSTLTNFKYLSSAWKRNTDEERLLGVSLTGIMDHPVLSGSTYGVYIGIELPDWLSKLKEVAIETNKEWSEVLGIPQSTAITCVKPSGTVSQLVNSASGIHPRYSEYYIRTVRSSVHDPITKFMQEQGVPNEVDVTNPNTIVFSFPIKSPDGAITRKQLTAIEQLELWKIYQEHWCEHKPSITVYYKPDEFMEVGAWVYENFEDVSGVSFLPSNDDDHVYQQAPYQEITEEQYKEALAKMPKNLDWSLLSKYEQSDNTTVQPELSCSAGVCEI